MIRAVPDGEAQWMVRQAVAARKRQLLAAIRRLCHQYAEAWIHQNVVVGRVVRDVILAHTEQLIQRIPHPTMSEGWPSGL